MTRDKRTSLALAAHFGFYDTVNFLLRQPSCDINACDKDNNTAAHHAATKCNIAILEAIQAHPKYQSNILNKAGKTADDIKHEILSTVFKRMLKYAH